MNCSQTFKNQKEVKFMKKEKCQGNLGVSKHEGNLCWPSHPSSKERILIHRKNHSLRVRKNGKLFMLVHQVEDIWQCQFPRWSRQGFVILTKRNDKLMVQDIGIQFKPVLMRAFAHEGAQDFSDKKLVMPDSSEQHEEKPRILPR